MWLAVRGCHFDSGFSTCSFTEQFRTLFCCVVGARNVSALLNKSTLAGQLPYDSLATKLLFWVNRSQAYVNALARKIASLRTKMTARSMSAFAG